MAHLHLRLLGGFALRDDTRPRPLPARKAQALLAYLALRAGRAHAREALIGLLWGGSRLRQGRQSLRQTMVRLRRALAVGRVPALLTESDAVTLDASMLDVDVVRFERLLRQGTLEALESAAALYQGPLLEGARIGEPAFDEWVESERVRVHDLALDALRRLVSRHVKAGRVERAIQSAARLATLDPLQEETHRTLMRLYARQGRRAAALRQYQACLTVLERELGVEPEPQTKRLYLTILQRAEPTSRGASGASRGDGVRGSRPLLPASDAPLVGRGAELTRARQRLRTALRGQGQVVLVRGEAGIGKTRLVEELVTAATTGGARVLLGRAYETEQILPFRPWMEALRAGHVLLSGARGERAPQATAGDLARLFPELARQATPPPITGESHLRLFESIDQVLADLAQTQPLLVVLEDLQWADDMTLRLLAFVGRRLVGRAILLVGTARDEELTEVRALQQVLAELTALPHVEDVTLSELSASSTATLVRALARAGSDDGRLGDVIDRVWALSEGNPLVIVETMRALQQGPLPEAAGVELPQRIRAMITSRLDRLSPRARELARTAAAFTRDFEFSVLQRAADLGRRETAEGIEELVRRRILETVGERLDFTHARIRQAVYQALLEPRRQTLHAAIAEALERVYAGRLDEMYERLAYHWARAGEASGALTYLVRLADKAARAYALEDAVRLLKDARAHGERLTGDDRVRRRLDVAYRLAHVLSLLGRGAEVLDLLVEHEPLVAGLGESAFSGPYHFWVAHTHANLGHSESAMLHGRRALEEAARCGDEVTMGQASHALAREMYMLGKPLEGITHGRQAVALLERGDEPWWLGQALSMLAWNLVHIGDFAPALDAIERMRTIGEALGERRLQSHAAWMAGRTYTLMDELELAIAACRRAVELAADPVARANALGMLGTAYRDLDEAPQAIAVLEDALAQLHELSGAGGYRYGQLDGFLTAVLSEAYLMKGETARARALGSKALAVCTAGRWPVAVGYALRARARLLVAEGEAGEAETSMRQAVETFVAADARCQAGRSRLALAEILARRGATTEATAEIRLATELFRPMRAPRLLERAACVARALGLEID